FLRFRRRLTECSQAPLRYRDTRKFTWYPSTAPGKSTALRTSAGFPLTVTSTGKLTITKRVLAGESARCHLVLVDDRGLLQKLWGRLALRADWESARVAIANRYAAC